MRRLGWLLGVILCLWLFPVLSVHAEETALSGVLEDTELAPYAEQFDVSDPETLTTVSFRDVLHLIREQLRDAVTEPLRTFLLLIGVCMMAALAGSLHDGEDGPGTVYETICVLCAVGIAVPPVSRALAASAAVLTHTADLTAGFSAVYAGVMAIGGGVSSAAVYEGSMAAACELSMEISARVLLPMLHMCLAMSIVDAINPAISLSGLIQLFQKLTAWILGLLMAVFLGMLSVQSMVSVSADRAGTRAAKYMISGCVPIIGGAVSDAYAAVLGSMGVLRSGVGFIGIAAILSLLLPVLTELGLYRLLTGVAAAAAELFGVPYLLRLFRNFEAVLAAGFSAAVSFSVMFVFSTAVMMLIGGGLSE